MSENSGNKGVPDNAIRRSPDERANITDRCLGVLDNGVFKANNATNPYVRPGSHDIGFCDGTEYWTAIPSSGLEDGEEGWVAFADGDKRNVCPVSMAPGEDGTVTGVLTRTLMMRGRKVPLPRGVELTVAQ